MNDASLRALPSKPELVLASTSRYRRELLARLALPFECVAPEVDETPIAHEAPAARALRLAIAKAESVAAQWPNHWVLGSDQVAALGTRILRKPGSVERACQQLAELSGQQAEFHTAICLARVGTSPLHHLDQTRVQFRCLDHASIQRYVAIEQPLDCAGAFKCEGLGISLFEAIESQDPTALIGLPLIQVANFLRRVGWQLP